MKRLLLRVVVVGVMFLGCSQSKQDYRAEGELEKENQSEGKGQAKQVVVASKIREVSIYGVIVGKTLKELGIERCEVKDGITVMPSDKACYEKEGSISLIHLSQPAIFSTFVANISASGVISSFWLSSLFGFSSEQFGEACWLLKEKFGPPYSSESNNYQNSYGVYLT